jgi:hypothetical protein
MPDLFGAAAAGEFRGFAHLEEEGKYMHEFG